MRDCYSHYRSLRSLLKASLCLHSLITPNRASTMLIPAAFVATQLPLIHAHSYSLILCRGSMVDAVAIVVPITLIAFFRSSFIHSLSIHAFFFTAFILPFTRCLHRQLKVE